MSDTQSWFQCLRDRSAARSPSTGWSRAFIGEWMSCRRPLVSVRCILRPGPHQAGAEALSHGVDRRREALFGREGASAVAPAAHGLSDRRCGARCLAALHARCAGRDGRGRCGATGARRGAVPSRRLDAQPGRQSARCRRPVRLEPVPRHPGSGSRRNRPPSRHASCRARPFRQCPSSDSLAGGA